MFRRNSIVIGVILLLMSFELVFVLAKTGDRQPAAFPVPKIGEHSLKLPEKTLRARKRLPQKVAPRAVKPFLAASGLITDSSSVFLEAVTYPTGDIRQNANTIADVNHDGIADVVFVGCGSTCGAVGVMLGNGDGTFQPPHIYSSGGFEPDAVTTADVNGDGKVDLVVANLSASQSGGTYVGNGALAILLGNGDGTFQAAQTYDTGALYATSVAVADINNDGNPDLVVTNQCTTANDCSGLVGILLGTGGGVFSGVQNLSSGGNSAVSVNVADVDQDGKLDLVVTNASFTSGGNGSVSVLRGKGNGTFQSPQTYSSGALIAFAAYVADVNNDGSPDVVVINQCASGPSSCSDGSDGSVGVLLNNNDGTFQNVRLYDSGGLSPFAVTVADINGDFFPDLVVANRYQATNNIDGTVSVLLGNSTGGFEAPRTYSTMGSNPRSVIVADVNSDGKPDVVVGNEAISEFTGTGAIAVMLGNGDGTLRAAPTYVSGGLDNNSAVAVADLNGDGKADLVLTNDACVGLTCNAAISVKLGNGDGTFQAARVYDAGGNFPRGLVVADVNKDGFPDLVVAIECADYQTCSSGGSNGAVAILLGHGDGTFSAANSYDSGGVNAASVAVADVNGDGSPDVLVANQCASATDCSAGSITVLLGTTGGTLQSGQTFSSGAYSPGSVLAADVNGDGIPDLIVANACLTAVSYACQDDGQIAVVAKVHLALMDGVGGMQFMASMFSLTPTPDPVVTVDYDVEPTTPPWERILRA